MIQSSAESLIYRSKTKMGMGGVFQLDLISIKVDFVHLKHEILDEYTLVEYVKNMSQFLPNPGFSLTQEKK